MAKKNNSNKDNNKLIKSLDDQVLKLNDCLNEIKSIVNEIQAGDGVSPYWNGTNAYNILKNILGQIDNDTVLVDYINKCRLSIEK